MHRRGHNNMGFDDFLNTYNNSEDAMNNFLGPTVDNYNNTNYKGSKIGVSSNTSFDAPSASKQVPNLDNQNRNVGMNAGQQAREVLTNSTMPNADNNYAPVMPLEQQNGSLPESISTENPMQSSPSMSSTGKLTDRVDIGNILGGGMMVGSSLMASKNLDDSIDDINKGLDGITGMISRQNEDTLNQIDSIEEDARNTINASADSSNLRLGQSLEKIRQSNINTGSIRKLSNDIRKKLNRNLDSTAKNVFAKSESAIDRINVSNRSSIDKIKGLQEQLKAKKKQAQKDKRMAQWSTAVGVGSLVSDAFVPGSGQALRSGFNTYNRYS